MQPYSNSYVLEVVVNEWWTDECTHYNMSVLQSRNVFGFSPDCTLHTAIKHVNSIGMAD